MRTCSARWALGMAVGCVGLVGGCSEPTPKPIEVQPTVSRDVHPLLRGTVGAEVEIRNVEDVLVSGFGLVVGLAGTGGGELPDNVASTMEREMGLMGIGRSGTGSGTAIDGRSPREILRDPNVAVVIVQAAIPAGAPANARFDVLVKALNATSLEGGTLWTTDLRFGQPAVFGAVQQRPVAKAMGPVFINPFADRGREQDGPTRDSGRVLDGGWVTAPQPIVLTLDNSSWARARGMVSAINSRFPEGAGDPGPTARGRSASMVELRVPRRFRTTPGEFLALVRHLPIDQQFPEQYAKRYAEGLKAEASMAEDFSWCLEAVGTKAIPFLRDVYDYPELIPRLAALRAGARLNDPRAADGLRDLARNGTGSVRTTAITLLGTLDGGPAVDMTLRELLASQELVTRVASYEALAERAERTQVENIRRAQSENPDAPRLSPTALEVIARARLPRNNLQGIDRRIIQGKFILDIVPFGEPMIYVTQQRQPRIVLFGVDQSIVRPMVATVWGDRLMIMAEASGPMRIRYTPSPTASASEHAVDGGLISLIDFMARKPTPEDPRPGLDLSYSDVVGALASLTNARVTRAAFATEQNKLRAQILAAAAGREQVERPEKPGDEPVLLNQPMALETPADKPPVAPKVIPIDAPKAKP